MSFVVGVYVEVDVSVEENHPPGKLEERPTEGVAISEVDVGSSVDEGIKVMDDEEFEADDGGTEEEVESSVDEGVVVSDFKLDV